MRRVDPLLGSLLRGGGQAAKAVDSLKNKLGETEAATRLIMGSSPILRFFIFKKMRKTILVLFLAILIVACTAKTDETTAENKEAQAEAKVHAQEETVQKQQEPAQEKQPAAEAEQQKITEAIITLDAGEKRRIDFEDKSYTVKLLSVSSRAQFNVNGEQTKDLMLNGVHTFRDQSQLQVLELLYNAAKIRFTASPEKEMIDSGALKGTGPQTLATGIFQKAEKNTAGHAEIIRTAEGSIVLQLHSFVTEPGAGLYVYLVNYNIQDGFEVAKLTTISGGQIYQLPEDLDLSKYQKIYIYSKSTGKVYGQAMIIAKNSNL